MGSSTYCLDIDYLLVCIAILSESSASQLKKKKKKVSFYKISDSFEIKQYVLGALCLEGHHLYSRSLG